MKAAAKAKTGRTEMIRDLAAIATLSGDDALLDAKLVEMDVKCGEDGAVINFRFLGRQGSQFREITLRFSEIEEFSLAYEANDIPFDVWDLKFIQLRDKSFYLTLDPDPSTLGAAGVKELDASDTDGFFVRAGHVEAFTYP